MTNVPDANHIARYCRPSTIANGRIQATAFYLRPSEDSLSVNWLEFFACTNREKEIIALRNAYDAKHYETKKEGKIAVLNVGNSRQYVANNSSDRRNITVLHNPSGVDMSHCGIHNMKPNETQIAVLLRRTILETHPAKT